VSLVAAAAGFSNALPKWRVTAISAAKAATAKIVPCTRMTKSAALLAM
jgi:hypothetical protein